MKKLYSKILLDKRKKIKAKYKIKDLVRTADIKRNFATGDSTNWSYKMNEISEIHYDTIPSYKFDLLPKNTKKAYGRKRS